MTDLREGVCTHDPQGTWGSEPPLADVRGVRCGFCRPGDGERSSRHGPDRCFHGTGQNILDNVTSVLPDVLIPFAVLLAISLIVKLYHKVRG